MANFVLQELPEEMSEGKKVVFPKMQTYSLHDYDTTTTPLSKTCVPTQEASATD